MSRLFCSASWMHSERLMTRVLRAGAGAVFVVVTTGGMAFVSAWLVGWFWAAACSAVPQASSRKMFRNHSIGLRDCLISFISSNSRISWPFALSKCVSGARTFKTVGYRLPFIGFRQSFNNDPLGPGFVTLMQLGIKRACERFRIMRNHAYCRKPAVAGNHRVRNHVCFFHR